MLDNVELVHMNGRIYDPMIGRFASADPVTEAPASSQGWNRYSYVGNSPVNFTDPSGYCFMGCFWNKAFKGLGNLLRKYPIIGTVIKVTAAAICTAVSFGGCAPLMAFISSAFVTGVTSGKLGFALKAGLIAAVQVVAFDFIGSSLAAEFGSRTPAFGTPGHIVKIASHAGVGCLSAMASGGNCGRGALSSAVSAAASPFMPGGPLGILGSGAVGGLAAVAGGGNFRQGAMQAFADAAATAAFGYMFNGEGGRKLGEAMGGIIGWAYFSAEDGPFAGRLGWKIGAAIGGQLVSDYEDAFYSSGPYSKLADPEGVGAGKDFTPEQKRMIIEENMRRNGGVVRSDEAGDLLTQPAKSQRGVTPDPYEWQIDHRWPKWLGGSNTFGNAQVLSRAENRAKWCNLPW